MKIVRKYPVFSVSQCAHIKADTPVSTVSFYPGYKWNENLNVENKIPQNMQSY